MLPELLIILLLILINGVFAMSEIALVSVRKSKLEAAARRGDKRAKMVLQLTGQPAKLFSTVQFGMTLMSILVGIFSGEHIKLVMADWFIRLGVAESYAHTVSLIIVLVIITTVTLIIGELVPKRIALSAPETIARVMAPPMLFISTVAKPFIWLLSKSSDLLFRILRVKAKSEDQVTEEEIKAIIQEGTETGAIDEIEQDIVERVFHLGDRRIGSLITHRNEIVWLNVNDPINKVRADIESEIHSVYPVCQDDIDHAIGIVYIKDIFLSSVKNQLNNLRDLIKPVLFLPENNTAYSVLEKFKKEKIHYALIVDEYGAIQGFVTINDILEAIVGEFDELNLTDYSIVQRDDGSFLIDAGLPFYDFLTHFEIEEEFENLDEMEFNTVAGFIIHELEHIPHEGEKLSWKDFEFEIIDMDATRIDKVLVRIKNKTH